MISQTEIKEAADQLTECRKTYKNMIEFRPTVNDIYDQLIRAIDVALWAIEKQIEKPVIGKKEVMGVALVKCPACNEWTIENKICKKCGQLLIEGTVEEATDGE